MTDRRLTLTTSLRPSALDARRGVVRLHPEILAAMGVGPWSPLRLTGTRTTGALAAFTDLAVPRGLLVCDDLILGNLSVKDGSAVTVEPISAIPARLIELTGPPEVTSVVSPENLRLALLGKVIADGDNASLLPQDFALPPGSEVEAVTAAATSVRSALGYAWGTVLLTVTSATPAEPSIVTMETVVRWRGGPATTGTATPVSPARPLSTVDGAAARMAELPGLKTQAAELREWFDLGFHHADLLARLGTGSSMGVLITGAPGSGKTSLVHAVAADLDAAVTSISGPATASLEPNAAAAALRDAVVTATQSAPSVLLVGDVEALAPRDGDSPVETVLLEIVRDALRAPKVAVVCTSGRPEEIDVRLRQAGMLDREIVLPLPDRTARRDILSTITRAVPLAADVSLEDLGGRTPGFVAADLIALLREAGVRAALRQRDVTSPTVAAADFAAALEVVRPTSMADSTLEVGQVSLDEVGDMTEVKQALTESVLWPLSYPDTFARLGVTPPRGVLLYGPPGCGKTFLVKAIANSGQANVLSVKGAELLSKWVGDSERGVRELFRRAREAAPTLIFLDEVDALAPMRGQSTDGGTTDRVVAALLTELDGVEDLRNVVVIGATNRPDLLDPALLRPGRLERLVYVPPPDAAARADILRAAATRVPFSDDVDLPSLASELDGFSAADCAALVREAALAAMRESLDSTTVTGEHVATGRSRVRASLDPAQVAALASYAAAHAQ